MAQYCVLASEGRQRYSVYTKNPKIYRKKRKKKRKRRPLLSKSQGIPHYLFTRKKGGAASQL
jgi:hypothetical protein